MKAVGRRISTSSRIHDACYNQRVPIIPNPHSYYSKRCPFLKPPSEDPSYNSPRADDVSVWDLCQRYSHPLPHTMSYPNDNINAPNPMIGTDNFLLHCFITTLLTCSVCLSRCRTVPTGPTPVGAESSTLRRIKFC